jgi:hypothetical protein
MKGMQTNWRRVQRIPLLLVLILIVGSLWWRASAPDVEPPVPSTRATVDAATTPRDAPPVDPASTPDAAPDVPAVARRDLDADERRGGHTLARHVGRTDAQLQERLARERGISAASTYPDRTTAERVVALTLEREARRVSTWSSRGSPRANLALDYRGAPGDVIGRVWRRGRRAAEEATDAVVVLRADRAGFYVLTSYPELRR